MRRRDLLTGSAITGAGLKERTPVLREGKEAERLEGPGYRMFGVGGGYRKPFEGVAQPPNRERRRAFEASRR